MASNNEELASNSSNEPDCSENSFKSDPNECQMTSVLDSGAFGTDTMQNDHQFPKKDRYRLNEILPMHIDEIQKEITLLQKMNHPNIVRCYTSWEDSNCDNTFYFIQMELCDRDLWQVIRREYLYDNRNLLRSYTRQILEGLNYIHETINMSHGDLKPENILIKSDQIKICDFGYAVHMDYLKDDSDSQIDLENCEIPSDASAYTAYEGMGKSTKSDMYSFGVILFEMCNPIFGSTRKALEKFRQNIDDPIIPNAEHDDYRNLYLKVIVQLIGRNAQDRPSAKYLLEEIPELFPETFIESKQLSSASSIQSDEGSDCDESPMDDPLLSEILSRFDKDWKIVKHLTTGNYGAIFKAKNYVNDEESAIKIMRLNSDEDLADESD